MILILSLDRAKSNHDFFSATESVLREMKKEAISDIKQNLIVIILKNLHANCEQMAN